MRPPLSLNEMYRSSQFDFQLSYSPFASIVVRGYHRVCKKIENVVPVFYQSLSERNKLLAELFCILLGQSVQTLNPWSLVNNVVRIAIPLVNGFAERTRYILGPVLPGVQFQEILQFAKQVRKAELVVEEIHKIPSNSDMTGFRTV